VQDSEVLGRRVYSRKRADRAKKGRVQKRLFLAKEGCKVISTDRLFPTKLVDIASIARLEGANRTGPFYGWAEIAVSNASQEGRRVKASPTRNNPYHADIVLPGRVASDREEQGRHAQKLADASSWRDSPIA
jgi:hypothetical protein